MSTWIMIAQFFLCLSLLIILHEWGHYITARWFKTRVEKFYLFFNPWFSLIKKKIGETEYGIGWLPLGGYVKISGMIDESMDKEQMKGPAQPWEFRAKPAWQRLIIMLGGIIVNFLLGFFIFAMMLWTWGESYLPADEVTEGIYVDSIGYELGLRNGDRILHVGDFEFTKFNEADVISQIILNGADEITVLRGGQEVKIPVGPHYASIFASADFKGKRLFSLPVPFVVKAFSPDSPAEEAGLKPGDRLISVNGHPTPYLQHFFDEIPKYKSKNINLGIIRNQDTVHIDVQTTSDAKIGVEFQQADHFYTLAHEKFGFLQSFPAGVSKGVNILTDQIKAFGKMFSGEIKASESLGGPIMIATLFPRTWDAQAFWRLTAILSLILGFMNLLPIPALDGGHVIFLLWEMITGKKPSDRFMEIVTMAGFILLAALMILIFGNDIRRFFF